MKKVVKIKRNSDVYFNVGEKKREEGKLGEAVYYFYLAFRGGNAEDSVKALIELANTYCSMEKYREAIQYYILALDRAPLSSDISNYIARAYTNLGEDDISFFYLAPGMSLDRYFYILKESEQYERFDRNPPVHVVEKNDDMALSIAIKLFESGDSKYAAQLLEAVKPDSSQYVTACNMLALYEIEQGNYEKAKKHLDFAILKRDNVLARCSQLLLLSKINSKSDQNPCFDDLRQLGIKGISNKIESFKLSLSEQKSVALAYIRAKEPDYALKYLAALLSANTFDKDVMVCYALCLYERGDVETARNTIFNAHYTFPEDASISYFLKKIVSGQTGLGLGPRMLPEDEKVRISEIDKKLDLIYKGKKSFKKDTDFNNKLQWLYQSGYAAANNKATMILGREKSYNGFLRELLLRGLDMQSKKVILFSLLLNGRDCKFVQKSVEYKHKASHDEFDFDEDFLSEADFIVEDEDGLLREASNVIRGIKFAKKYSNDENKEFFKARKKKLDPESERDFETYVYKGRLGIVLDDFYTRIRIVYPKNMDTMFHTGYCAAFSSFVFCDSCFEDRLLGAALRALKKYNAPDFDKSLINSEEALAAALFFAAYHSEISSIRQCSQLFACSQQTVSSYLKLLCLRQTKQKFIK